MRRIRPNMTSLRRTGISMVEFIIYIGIVSMLVVAIVAALIQIVGTYNQVRSQRAVVSNGRLAMETIMQAIAGARALYAPTSTFGNSAGQLSLVTAVDAQAEETVNRVDFWLDNGRIWMHKEGSATTSITSPSVHVNQLQFDQISQSLGREAIRITLQISNAAGTKFVASSTLYATTALRGAY